MTYKELQDVVQVIQTGATNPSKFAILTKLVLGKISRRRLKERLKIGEITTGAASEFILGSSSILPDFLALKTYPENQNKSVYYIVSDSPRYFQMTNHSRFREFIESGFATLDGRTLKLSYFSGDDIPGTVFVPYFSKYLVLDEDGITEKETPSNSDDTFLMDTVFDDALVEGILIYLTRRDKSAGEFNRAVKEWEQNLNEILFYNS